MLIILAIVASLTKSSNIFADGVEDIEPIAKFLHAITSSGCAVETLNKSVKLQDQEVKICRNHQGTKESNYVFPTRVKSESWLKNATSRNW